MQPVLLLYSWDRFSPAWECIAAGRHIFFLLSHLYQTLEVVFLPVYVPSEEEKKDPALYAQNVRQIMAEAGKFKLTHHTLAHKRVYQGILTGAMDPSAADAADKPGPFTVPPVAGAAAGPAAGAGGNGAGGGAASSSAPEKQGSGSGKKAAAALR